MKHQGQRTNLPVAIVTGACGGMGSAVARRLAQSFHVVLADLNESGAKALAGQLCEDGMPASAARCDVTDADSVATLFADVRRRGTLAAVAHVVGRSPATGTARAILDVNLIGAARIAEAAAPQLADGAAVFIASIAGRRVVGTAALNALIDAPLAPACVDRLIEHAGAEFTAQVAYQYSKYGVHRMVRRLAPAWGKRGARILSLSPGLIASSMADAEFERDEAHMSRMVAGTPLGRLGSLQEIADVVEFLLSARASFITGSDVLVDGGICAGLGM